MYSQDKTRLCALTLMWVSVEVVVGIRIVQCHAIMNVVIGVRVMICHQAIDNSQFFSLLNFPLRVKLLILSSSCINSSSLFPVAILCTLLHLENVILGVVFTHTVVYNRPPSAVNDPYVTK